MPVINNATVATGTGLSTAGNGGRRLVRMANGLLISGHAINSINPSEIRILKSIDNGATWSQLCFFKAGGNNAAYQVSLQTQGNFVYAIMSDGATGNVVSYTINALTQTNVDISSTKANVDTGQTSLFERHSLAINEAGTELHAAWSSKNATYPNSFNIRYAKGTINGDGSVTWGAVDQVTKLSSSGFDVRSPVVVTQNDKVHIFVRYQNSYIVLFSTNKNLGSYITSSSYNSQDWGNKLIQGDSSYLRDSPSAIHVPQIINSIEGGRVWLGWHANDASSSNKLNIFVTYSDDGGVTWATPVKLTSGNLYDRQNVSLAADKTGKVFALYEEHQWSPDLDIYMRTFSGGSWGAPVAVAEADPAAESNPSALVDYSLMMTTPPFVFTNATDGIKFSGNFNVGASVSPASGALGNKETATLTAYTVTPEAGSTVTSIVEKVNGVTVNTFNNPASLSRTLTVPTATWDTLAYFATHTASITVTDSNGATTVTTYSFDKRLATGASLLEAEKANRDAKNRISQKRDLLASQVGLSAGSTFDAIIGAFGSSVVKRQEGTVVSSNYNSSNFTADITLAGLSFPPKMIMIYNGRDIGFWFEGQVVDNPTGDYRSHSTGITGKLVLTLGSGNSYYVNSTGFSLPIYTNQSNRTYNYIVLG